MMYGDSRKQVVGRSHISEWPSICTTRCMDNSTKDQIEGALHEVKGKVKETAGQVLSNPDLEAEGQAENLGGKIQKKVGQIEKVFEK